MRLTGTPPRHHSWTSQKVSSLLARAPPGCPCACPVAGCQTLKCSLVLPGAQRDPLEGLPERRLPQLMQPQVLLMPLLRSSWQFWEYQHPHTARPMAGGQRGDADPHLDPQPWTRAWILSLICLPASIWRRPGEPASHFLVVRPLAQPALSATYRWLIAQGGALVHCWLGQ